MVILLVAIGKLLVSLVVGLLVGIGGTENGRMVFLRQGRVCHFGKLPCRPNLLFDFALLLEEKCFLLLEAINLVSFARVIVLFVRRGCL